MPTGSQQGRDINEANVVRQGLATAAAQDGASSGGAATVGPDGELLFAASPNEWIFFDNDAGENVYAITPNSTLAHLVPFPDETVTGRFSPRISPDGEKLLIAVTRAGSGRAEIDLITPTGGLTILADTQGVTNVQNDQGEWSHDGSMIAWFINDFPWVMDADGSNKRSLGTDASTRGYGAHWSLDDSQLAVTSPDPWLDVLLINVSDGSVAANLTQDTADVCHPIAWSPDGETILFRRLNPISLLGEVWAMNADGTGKTQLTSLGGRPQGASYSPDGSRIAFSYYTANLSRADIYLIDADGGGLSTLTGGFALDSENSDGWQNPSWGATAWAWQ